MVLENLLENNDEYVVFECRKSINQKLKIGKLFGIWLIYRYTETVLLVVIKYRGNYHEVQDSTKQ